MTLYNLGDEDNPLVTLDFADPNRNVSDKSLARQWGPILLGYYDDLEVVFTLNRLYLNSPHHAAGVRLPGALKDDTQRQIKIARGGRLSVGSLLFENLTENPEVIGRFARLGLRIRRASPEAVLEPLPAGRGSRLYFRRPLVEATRVGTEVYRYFFPDTEEAKPGPRQGKGIAATEIEIAKKKENLVHLREKNGRLVIVVEGAGDWVEQTYRPLLRRAVKERGDLSVFWVDDTRWKPCPKWADSSEPDHDLQPWEIYLDKANPDDLAAYRQLLPDLVFIVTPDFTHSAIARRWLGRSPLVFVEKPFDSQLSNVYDLLREMGRQRGTAVLGLDHYQFYALPLHELKPEIERHLDRSLAKVVFHMTEKRPIELDRVRTLQYGLTLDMLPHFPAILTHFGDVGTIDEIRVVDARQYRPLIAASRDGVDQKDISDRFHNETYSRIRFTFRDYSGNGYNVPCVAVVGKGLSQDVKYLEATGRSGNAIRLDLNRRPESDPAPDYPWDSVFFLQGDQTPLFPRAQVREMPDPYNQRRTLRVLYDPTDPGCFCRTLERERYKKMIEDLQNGTRKAVPSTLSLTEALEIVRALDRIWWACQAAKPWKEYRLNGLDPVGSREDL
jgi:predicted dehydrogenase